MLNWLWGFMIIIGIVYALITGNIESVTQGAFVSCQGSCHIMYNYVRYYVILVRSYGNSRKSGLIDKCRYMIEPLIKWLFPGVPSSSKAFGYIVTNMISNFLGLGWAATPAGIKAMKEMAVLNQNKNIASCDMCTFLVINISSIQLIPVNIIAYRSQYKSPDPTAILFPSIIATTISTLAAVIFCRVMTRRER